MVAQVTMKIENIDVNEAIEKAKASLKDEKNISSTGKDNFEVLLEIIKAMMNKLNLNSSNSSKPPSSDTDADTDKKRKKSNNPRGGQKGHEGVTLEPVDNPDEIENITIDKRTLPRGKNYQSNGYKARQVINITISKIITEYRAEILIDGEGNQYIAPFPQGIIRPIQYGTSIKVKTTYLLTYQLIPYERIREQFKNEYNIPISTGSICNFNAEASRALTELGFIKIVKYKLTQSPMINVDETGINLDGKKIWLHTASNDHWTWLEPHAKRGIEAMDDIGIIPFFKGVLCHDHWKPYYHYSCPHALCNAHHLRELKRSFEQDGQAWAEQMRLLLLKIKGEVNASKRNALSKQKSTQYREQYREILSLGDKECPPPIKDPNKKGRTKRSKSRNLLERLRNYEDDTLRFMEDPLTPFTNNDGEQSIRMSKVQQKISGCFRSMKGARDFCTVRSYLATCKKHNISATEALTMLFNRTLPDFLLKELEALEKLEKSDTS